VPEFNAGLARDISRTSPKFDYALRTRAFTIFCAVMAGSWFLIDAFLLPPSFGATDIYYFKDAGINFAEGLGLVSRFTFGNPTFEYHAYSQYPPAYPLLFGLFVKLFGTSVLSNQVFNSTIGLCSGIVAYFAFKPLLALNRSYVSAWLPFVIFALLVFLGYFDAEYDRPDSLGLIFGLLALLLASRSDSRRRRARQDLGAGCMCALALVTSPFAGIWSSLAVAIVVMADTFVSDKPVRTLARIQFVVAGGVLMLLAAGISIALLLPGWFDAFAGVLTGANTKNETGGGYFVALLHGDFKTWASAIPWGHPALIVTAAKLIVVQITLALAVFLEKRVPGRRFQGIGIVALLAASPLSLLLSPYQLNYVAMTAALLLAGAACLTVRMSRDVRAGYSAAILTALLLMGSLCLPLHLRQIVVRSATQESLIRARTFIAHNKDSYASSGKYLAVASQTYMLWREAGVRPLATIYSGFDDPGNRRLLGTIALAYPGSASLYEPQKPKWLGEDEYSLEHRPQLPQPLTFFGVWASRSSQTWESAIYRRLDETGR
jgi:Dolichyl-phosphate-mannose-protein mannosyltransferase